VARLRRLLELLEARQNQLFAPIAAMLLWSTQLGLAIEAWRALSGAAVPRWLEAVGEFEALCALASYAFEHPADPFPELLEGGIRYEAEGLGHPLLPEARSVRNDLQLGPALRLLVVSGSNMSGKSTWLRTIGTNAVLAFAGAPVRARSMALSPLALGSSLRILDSLQSGASKFYAEITRIGEIVTQARGERPLLFLLDEILNGTNSHDRRIGAEAIVKSLVDRDAIGLVTTHDLALARIADELAPRAENVHFEDQLVDGEMRFDYRLRPGVVARSNALALMRAVGLEV
jgi:DNA mismatch repair ATPase MutS